MSSAKTARVESGEPARKTALAPPKVSASSRPTSAGSPSYSVSRPASSSAEPIRLSSAGNLLVSNTSRISRPMSDPLPTSATVPVFGARLANLDLRWRVRPQMTPHDAADPDDDSAGDIGCGHGQQDRLRIIPDKIDQA